MWITTMMAGRMVSRGHLLTSLVYTGYTTTVICNVSVSGQVDGAVSCYQKDLSSEDGYALPGEEKFRHVSETAHPGELEESRQGDHNAERHHEEAALNRIWPEEACCSGFVHRPEACLDWRAPGVKSLRP